MVVNWWRGRRCEAGVRPHLEPEEDRQEGEGEVMKRGWVGIKHRAEFTGRQRVKEERKAAKYHFPASPCGGHIQLWLCAEWVQDHVERNNRRDDEGEQGHEGG